MRPHRLRVTAFGAFGGTVEVSFEDLACSGLFLLHGETGAGKTTLLDAIGFALYGRVPGERGKARRLRSDHAASGTSTEVQLEATLGGRRMRITRKPEQERAKLRGTGTTTEQARVLLEEQAGGSWRAVSTRVGEADAEIADLMGMSADQFFQVVLLPQGEFARFLHADAGTGPSCCSGCSARTGSTRSRNGSPAAARPPRTRCGTPRRGSPGCSPGSLRPPASRSRPTTPSRRTIPSRPTTLSRRTTLCRPRAGPRSWPRSPRPRPRPGRPRSPATARSSTRRLTCSATPNG